MLRARNSRILPRIRRPAVGRYRKRNPRASNPRYRANRRKQHHVAIKLSLESIRCEEAAGGIIGDTKRLDLVGGQRFFAFADKAFEGLLLDFVGLFFSSVPVPGLLSLAST